MLSHALRVRAAPPSLRHLSPPPVRRAPASATTRACCTYLTPIKQQQTPYSPPAADDFLNPLHRTTCSQIRTIPVPSLCRQTSLLSFSAVTQAQTGSDLRALSAARPAPRSSYHTRFMQAAQKAHRRALRTYNRLSPTYKIAVIAFGLCSIVTGILLLVYHGRILAWLAPLVKKFRQIKAGWLILWFAIIVSAFPPLIGYSTLLTITGIVYGFPNGATIIGSTLSFIASRSLLRNMVHRMIAHDKRFAALSLILKHDGIKLLWMIRLCPLPYSLSNGGIATFPTVRWTSYAIATAASTPKLMLHIFVGSKLGEIAENSEKMDAKTKALSYLSMLIGGTAGIVTGWYMYRKTTARAKELEAEERDHVRNASVEDLEHDYADDPDALEAAEGLLGARGSDRGNGRSRDRDRGHQRDQSPDGISLMSGMVNGAAGSYHDETTSSSSDDNSDDELASSFHEGVGPPSDLEQNKGGTNSNV